MSAFDPKRTFAAGYVFFVACITIISVALITIVGSITVIGVVVVSATRSSCSYCNGANAHRRSAINSTVGTPLSKLDTVLIGRDLVRIAGPPGNDASGPFADPPIGPLIAFAFATGAPPEKGTRRAVVISDDYDLQKHWRPDRRQILSDAAPAPAPDMTSPLVLAAQPKDQSPPEVLPKSAATDQKQLAARRSREALAARAEAPPTKSRVTVTQPPVEYRQNNAPPGRREFGLSGIN